MNQLLKIVLTALLALFYSATLLAGTIYVKYNATGSNNGSDWSNAYNSLQSALDNAFAGTQIWVAKGTYKPSSAYDLTNTSRFYHFRLEEGIKVYGGFSGTENSIDQRVSFSKGETNETILSGDLNGDDNFDITLGGYQSGTGNDNCYHVWYIPTGLNLTSNTLLDGFTIKGGNATGSSPHSTGGGISIVNSSPAFNNVWFECNASQTPGGAAYIQNSASTFSKTTFNANYTGTNGGGIYIYGNSPVFENVSFISNRAAFNGGGLYAINSSSPVINNAVFSANVVTVNGGAVYINASTSNITNTLIKNNSAVEGGGIYSRYTIGATNLNNVTISGNTASSMGGGIRYIATSATSALNINNSIVWGNTATTSGNELSLASAGSTTFNYSCYKNGTNDVVNTGGTLTATNNNISSNPGFANAAIGDFSILGNSPCLNKGLNSYNTLVADIRGQARIQNTTIDMGAYEWTAGLDKLLKVVYVNKNAGGANNGVDWANAFTSLQSALDITPAGNQIWVAKGTYKPSKDYGLGDGSDPKKYHFRMINGVGIYGGFDGTETQLSQRKTFGAGEANETILSGDLSNNDNFDVNNGGFQTTTGDENCYHVLYHPNGLGLTSTAILNGFTIRGGNASDVEGGGGMYNMNAKPTISNVIFTHNYANNGGGMYNYFSSHVTIDNVQFVSNVAGESGGAILISESNPNINHSVFTSNRSSDGGACIVYKSNPVFYNCVFTANKSDGIGGAIQVDMNSWVQITNTLIWGNMALTGGGLAFDNSSGIDIFNSTISGNSAGNGGGISGITECYLYSYNSIIWENTASAVGNEIFIQNTTSHLEFYNTCFKNTTNDVITNGSTFDATHNNINSNPFFVNASSGDFRVCGNSPAVNTGANTWNNTLDGMDIRGQARIQNTTIDMGAYEWTSGIDPASNITLVSVKVLLEGAFDSGSVMKNTLNGPDQAIPSDQLIPLTHPYGVAPWSYTGTENKSGSTIPAGVVDWVLLELRDAATALGATSSTILAKRAAFVKINGSIVDLDGTSPVRFEGSAISTNLYVVIRHRNHLAVMSANAVTPADGVYTYDFTSGLDQAYGGSAGNKLMPGGKAAMVTGDANHDGNIFVTDYNIWATGFGTTRTYSSSDLNMDGSVFVTDYNKWATNFGSTISVQIKSALMSPRYFSCIPR